MKQCAADIWFVCGYLIAHLLLFFTFEDKAIFWHIFSATMLFLISFSIIKEELDDRVSFWNYISFGAVSGVFIFSLFSLGNYFINVFDIPLYQQVSALYGQYAPKAFWHYLVLILIIVPGEEIFWRGFIQKRLLNYTNKWTSILVSTIMYTSVHFYADHWMLAFAAFVAGIFWSSLYAWKRSIPLVIVSHLVFDLFLFVILPFR